MDGGGGVAGFASLPAPLRWSVLDEHLPTPGVRVLERVDSPSGEGRQQSHDHEGGYGPAHRRLVRGGGAGTHW